MPFAGEHANRMLQYLTHGLSVLSEIDDLWNGLQASSVEINAELPEVAPEILIETLFEMYEADTGKRHPLDRR